MEVYSRKIYMTCNSNAVISRGATPCPRESRAQPRPGPCKKNVNK
jgi:hypothetical protein